jgi:hypothetical protein
MLESIGSWLSRMSRTNRLWVITSLAAAGLAGGLLLLRHAMQDGQGRSETSQPTSAINFGASGSGLSAEASPIAPESPEAVADEVEKSLGSWRSAILARDADTVMMLDRMFTGAPGRYAAGLSKSAAGDADERVRAFSTRVLGKLKDPAFAAVFENLLADKSPFVRQNAAWALGELASVGDGKTAARRALVELRQVRSRDPAPNVRSAAKGALARLE